MKHTAHHAVQGLYIVTPDWDNDAALLTATEQAILGGAQWVQYRHKTASAEQRFRQAGALQDLCRAQNVPLIVNDDMVLCRRLNCDGVHVGSTDHPIEHVREYLGSDKIIGASCYGSLELAQAAKANGASYIAFGGFYPSRVKQYEVSTQVDIIAQAKACIDLPVVVIGGMTADNCGLLIAQGADMVAVISGVYGLSAEQVDLAQVHRRAQAISDLFQ